MTKGLVTRRTALKALGASAGAIAFLPWLSDEGLAAFSEIQRAKAAPALKVLTPAQYATVEALVEAIIPTDERSPGAREARVADYIDLLLSEAAPDPRQEWLDGLAALDAEAKTRFGAPFLGLDAAQVETLLADISRYEAAKSKNPPPEAPLAEIPRNEEPKEKAPLVENLWGDLSRLDPARRRPRLEDFFATTKRATIHGYYTSDIGIHQELHYKGNRILLEFTGCQTQDGKDCPYCGQKVEA